MNIFVPFVSVAHGCILCATYYAISDMDTTNFINFLENCVPILSVVFASLFGVIMYRRKFSLVIRALDTVESVDIKLSFLNIYMKYHHWSILILLIIVTMMLPLIALPFAFASRKTMAYYYICYAIPIEIRGAYIAILNIGHGFIIERLVTLNRYLEKHTEELYFSPHNCMHSKRKNGLGVNVAILEQVTIF